VKTLGFNIALVLLVSAGALETRAAPQRDARVRPPAQIECARDRHHLTSYTGSVLSFVRGTDRTTMQIRTDWDTTEEVVITHKGSDPVRWFLLHGSPFGQADWTRITDADGQLRKGMRATAWVCSDGSNPIVDWDVPRE
jgi:hypothetical protein